jgi:hypothetical protein
VTFVQCVIGLLFVFLFCAALCIIKSGITLEMMKQYVLSTNSNCFIERAWGDKFDNDDNDEEPQLKDVLYAQGVESMYRLIMELCTRLYTQVRAEVVMCDMRHLFSGFHSLLSSFSV